MASIRNAIEQAVLTILQGVPFDGISITNIRVGELPEGGSTAAPLPAVIVAPYGKSRTVSAGTEGASRDRIYPVQIVMIAAIVDFTSNQARYESWPEAVVSTLCEDSNGDWLDSLPGVPSVWAIRVMDDATFDREKLSKLYAYQSVVVEFHSNE